MEQEGKGQKKWQQQQQAPLMKLISEGKFRKSH